MFNKDDKWEDFQKIFVFPTNVVNDPHSALKDTLSKGLSGMNIFDPLAKIMPRHPPYVEIRGRKGVLEALADIETGYERDFEQLLRDEEMDIESFSIPDVDVHDFLLLYDSKEDDIAMVCGIRGFIPEAHNYLFQSRYIPMTQDFVHESDGPSIMDIYLSEMSVIQHFKQEHPGKKILVLLHYCGEGKYKVWSYDDEEIMYIRNFKTYREWFDISQDFYSNTWEPGNDEYAVYVPSYEFHISTNLCFSEEDLSLRCPGDGFDPRPPKELDEDIVEALAGDDYPRDADEVYKAAINAINLSRAKDLGHVREYFLLEKRTSRLERLAGLGGPAKVICKELDLIKEALDSIGS